MALPTRDQLVIYIRQAAIARGIDPNVAVRVATSEGLNANPLTGWRSSIMTRRGPETSYGPFQLYTGGGLGNDFQSQTGLDPTDPNTVYQQIDFALNNAAQNGWGAFHGARSVGIGNWQGLSGAQPVAVGSPLMTAVPPVPQARPSQSMDQRFADAFAPEQTLASLLGSNPLAYAQQPESPAVQAVNAEANSTIPQDAPQSQSGMAGRFADAFAPAPNIAEWLSPTFAGNRPQYADQSLPAFQQKPPVSQGQNIFTAYGQSGKAPENIIMADLSRPSDIPFSSSPATQSQINTATNYGAGAYDPFGTRTANKDQSRMAEYSSPSQPRAVATQTVTAPPGGNYGEGVFPSLVGSAQAAESIPSITVNPLSDYQRLTGSPMPTVADLGFKYAPEMTAPVQAPAIEVQQPVKKPVPTPIVRPAMVAQPKKSPLADILSNPLGRGVLGYAMGGPLGALLGAGSAYLQKNGGLGSIFGGSGSVPALSNVTSHSANYNPTSGGSQYSYRSGTDSQGNQVVSYRTNSGSTITYRNNPDGTTTMYNL